MNSCKSQNHSRGQALRLLFPWHERMGIFLPSHGDRIQEIRAKAGKGKKAGIREEAREKGSPMPLFSPQANAACLMLTQWKE